MSCCEMRVFLCLPLLIPVEVIRIAIFDLFPNLFGCVSFHLIRGNFIVLGLGFLIMRIVFSRNGFHYGFPLAGDTSASRGLSLEKKIEALESMSGQVSSLFSFFASCRRSSVTFTTTHCFLYN